MKNLIIAAAFFMAVSCDGGYRNSNPSVPPKFCRGEVVRHKLTKERVLVSCHERRNSTSEYVYTCLVAPSDPKFNENWWTQHEYRTRFMVIRFGEYELEPLGNK